MVSRFQKGVLLTLVAGLLVGGFFVHSNVWADKNNSSNPVDFAEAEYAPGELIVKLKEEKKHPTGMSVDKVSTPRGDFIVKKRIPNSDIAVVEVGDGEDVKEVARELNDNLGGDVVYAEPNYLYRVLSTSLEGVNDTHKNDLWALYNFGQTVNGVTGTTGADIDAAGAWSKAEGQNIIVAVIDSGVQYTHPDLQNNMWDGTNCKNENGSALGGCIHGYDYKDNNKDPRPVSSSHGTHVAGIIAAQKNNSRGVIGVSPQSKIMAIRAGDDLFASSAIIAGIKFAEANGAKVINASFGGAGFNQTMKDTIADFSGLFIAAAGNSSVNHSTSNFYPCDYELDNIICVAATTQGDQLAGYSDYGSSHVHVGAPGDNILSSVADISVSTLFSENFAAASLGSVGDKFTAGGSENNWGVRSNEGNKGISPTATIHSPYASNANSLLTVIDGMNTGGVDRVSLRFNIQCDTESGNFNDRVQVQFLNSSGQWVTSNNWRYNSSNVSSDSLESRAIDLDHASYFYDGFKFRFNWITNNSNNNYKGCDIDDIEVLTYTLGSGEQYSYSSGTSMAAPHVAGLVALIMSYKPDLGVSTVKQTVLNAGDSLSALSNKTVSGKRINAQKALASLSVASPTPTLTPTPTPTPTPVPTVNPTPTPNPLQQGVVPQINSIFRRAFGVNPTVDEWRYWADRSIKDKPNVAALFGAMQYHSIVYGRSPVLSATPPPANQGMIPHINRFVRMVWGVNPTFNRWQHWANRITSGNIRSLPQLLGAMQWQRMMGN